MTLRQEYARPRPRAITATRTSPARAAAPAHTGPAGISPPHQPGPGAQLPQQPSQPKGRFVPIAAPGLGRCPRHLPATGWTPAAWLLESDYSPIPGVRAPPQGGAAPAGTRHRRCLSPAACPAACAAGPVSSGLFPQVAGIGPVPVGVLWVSCRRLRVVNPSRRS